MADGDDQIINPFSTPLQNPGSDKRLRILAAAEEIISNKGFKEATISEIASQAGINDSIIYRHFKGKEDILFSIAEERLKDGLALLDRDLQGLIDPKSQLRKMMWGNLWYQNAYSAYSRILLFECRSSFKFYSSPAFLLIQKYLGRLTAILEQGVKEGIFREDVTISLMRDMIMGTLDMTTIGFHELKEVENPMFDFEDAAALIELIIIPRTESESSNFDKYSIILESAEKVFAEKGFNRTKMTEIAQLAGVGDGTVYEYFENKDLLLFSIPKRRFEQYFKDLSGVFNPDSVISKLKKLIKYHFSTFLADPHFLRIFALNLFLNKSFYKSEAFEAFRNYYRLLEEVIEEGKTGGAFRSEVNPRVFRNMMLGTFYHMVIRWLSDAKMSEVDMMKEVNQLTDLLTEAVLISTSQDGSGVKGYDLFERMGGDAARGK
ncbi:MAG: TetR/AcrR family transcriptional regulator [Thermodesulfobacteriota bacterium]|jgi:TetR/AcrR family fatty acid metabolism transcriptional regulator